MSATRKHEGAAERIGGKTLDQWNREWERMEGGFAVPHPALHDIIGLYRTDLDGEPMTMGYATDFNGGGLWKRLQTIRSSVRQTGNNHLSADFISANIHDLTLWVIKVDMGAGSELITRKLCGKLRKLYGLKRGVIGTS
jgi:hypothetical protein